MPSLAATLRGRRPRAHFIDAETEASRLPKAAVWWSSNVNPCFWVQWCAHSPQGGEERRSGGGWYLASWGLGEEWSAQSRPQVDRSLQFSGLWGVAGGGGNSHLKRLCAGQWRSPKFTQCPGGWNVCLPSLGTEGARVEGLDSPGAPSGQRQSQASQPRVVSAQQVALPL